MRVVEINTVCGTGSTGKICADLYKIAEANAMEPYIAYGRGNASPDFKSFKIGNTLDFFCHVLTNFFNGNSGFGSKGVTKLLLNWLDSVKPDLLHLHNLHGFYIHVGMLFDYIKVNQIPVIWTLHDCWSFTGQCAHFDYEGCCKWKTQCHHCALYKKEYPYSLFKDNSYENYRLKQEAFTGVKNMVIVTPSKWLADLVSSSYLRPYPVKIIPNGIDLELFTPLPIGRSPFSKIILGVANIWSARKGLTYFYQLSNLLDETFHIVLIGVNKKQQHTIHKNYGKRITALTRTQNAQELAGWYRRAYAFVNPTLEDNFPTTNLEALACGTPVITFDTGGSPECIDETCGIVVEKGNLEELKTAIISLEANTLISREACYEKGNFYDKNIRFLEYIDLYCTLLRD